ncbi:MAG: hypothetical protein IJU79_00090 [Desulfovibrionaceae bacterium]|nr:hypothetical protein [Desulfovibrionaceae bacterium]
MKIRTDFVTNSSSSSFIIARKPTEKQDKVMVEFAEQMLLGEDTTLLLPGSTKEEVTKALDYLDDEYHDKVLKLLKDGFQVSIGTVSFEPGMEAVPYQELWERLERADKKNFIPIDCDLNY